MVLSDPEWKLPHLEEVIKTLSGMTTKDQVYIPQLFACEEFAFSLVAEVRQYHAKKAIKEKWPEPERRNWPLALVYGNRFYGGPDNHYLNVIDTIEGVYVIEPQNYTYWRANGDLDQVIFLNM